MVAGDKGEFVLAPESGRRDNDFLRSAVYSIGIADNRETPEGVEQVMLDFTEEGIVYDIR